MAGGVRGHDAAVCLHDHQLAGNPTLLQFSLELCHIAVDQRLDVGIYRCGSETFDFSEFGQYVGANSDVRIAPDPRRNLCRAAFMRWVRIGIQEANQQRFTAFVLQRQRGTLDGGFVQLLHDPSGGAGALGNLDPMVA